MDEDQVVADADRVGKRIWKEVLSRGAITIPRLRSV
jgi:hypothetical protein